MRWVIFIKKLVASIFSVNLNSKTTYNSAFNSNYIMALNPMEKDGNLNGYIIIVMLLFIVILIGYTILNNSKNK